MVLQNKWLHFDTRLKHLENVIAEKQVVQRWSENDTKRSRVMVVDIPEPDTCSLSTRVPPNTEIQVIALSHGCIVGEPYCFGRNYALIEEINTTDNRQSKV